MLDDTGDRNRSLQPIRPSSEVYGGELEQIQFLLGHASVLTAERYLGCKQKSLESDLSLTIARRICCVSCRSEA